MKELKELGVKFDMKMTAPQMKALRDDALFEKAAKEEEAEAIRLAAEAKAREEEEAKAAENKHKGSFDSDEKQD